MFNFLEAELKNRKSAFRKAFEKVAVVTALAGVLVVPLGIGAGVHYGTRHDMRVTIENTHKSLLHKGEGFGLTKTVYETDKGDLTNTWSIYAGKMSRDPMGDYLKVGGTYDVTVAGMNIPFLSIYPNIISANHVTPPPAP